VDTRRSVGSAALGVDALDRPKKLTVGLLTLAVGTLAPGVVAAAGDPQHLAHHAYSEGLPVLVDEPELHVWSSAK
jgi:hypothetical protein